MTLAWLPPASPELNPAARVFAELRRAVGAELGRIAADPERVRSLTHWGWIAAAVRQLRIAPAA